MVNSTKTHAWWQCHLHPHHHLSRVNSLLLQRELFEMLKHLLQVRNSSKCKCYTTAQHTQRILPAVALVSIGKGYLLIEETREDSS